MNDWAKDSLAIAIEQNIIKGEAANLLAQVANVTRAEAAAVVDRLIKEFNF